MFEDRAMKVKEISRTANVAWSPAAMQDILVACGTVAQQLDATFRYSLFPFDLLLFRGVALSLLTPL